MPLSPILLSVDAGVPFQASPVHDADAEAKLSRCSCDYCGGELGRSFPQAGSGTACPLCLLSLHTERPFIDDEAVLVWLPEMSQQAVNVIMREVHMQLQALGEAVQAGAAYRGRSQQLRALHATRAVLTDRVASAEDRVGTSSPGDLGSALLDMAPLAYDRRGYLLGGLRLLPLGRFFEGGRDVYPEILMDWRKGSQTQPSLSHTTR